MTGLRLSPVDRLLAERPYFRGNLKSILLTVISATLTYVVCLGL